ncbi:RNA polymerase sigma factor SigF [Saccharopolyspora sp. 5N102]|uniref:RNA polymerase sigma factor SigF n=1 Tax=Saccharopolyspora sp. 5N102 TaxID=3375155 RepID=UPI00379AA5FE
MSDTKPEAGRGEYDALFPLFIKLSTLDKSGPRYAAVRDELVTGHLPVAEHIAQRFRQRGESYEDLVQVATVGLIHAVDRFDPGRGISFLSFAVPTITGEVRRHFRDTGWSVRMPRRLQELHLAVSGGISALTQELGRAPTPSELARHLDLGLDEVLEGLEAGNAYRSSSLDELITDDIPLADAVGVDDAELAEVDDRETLRPLLAQLPEREQRILLMRFFKGMTQTQIAQQIGISQMHVSRLLAGTLARLRRQAAPAEPVDAAPATKAASA